MPSCHNDLTSVDADAAPTSSISRISGGTPNSINLYPYIAQHLSHGLNISPDGGGVSEILRPHDTRNERDPDKSLANLEENEGVIIHVPFTDMVRVKSVLLNVGVDDESISNVKIWSNRVDGVDWSQVLPVQEGGLEPDAVWEPLRGSREATEYPVKVTKFSNVSCVTLYFEPSRSLGKLRTFYLGFKGEARGYQKSISELMTVGAENASHSTVDSLRQKQDASTATASTTTSR